MHHQLHQKNLILLTPHTFVSFPGSRQKPSKKQKDFIFIILPLLQYTLICMNRLYSIAFKRILASLGSQEITPSNVESLLQSNKVKPIGSFVFHRLAREQVRHLIKTPCPVQNVEAQQNKAIIKSSKALRASFSVVQQKVCNRCPHKQKCPQFAKAGQENNVNAISDLLVFMQAMNNNAALQVNAERRVWMSGYRACDSIIATLEDLKRQSPQSFEYQKIRLKHIAQNEQRQVKAGVQKKAEQPKSEKKAKKEPKQPKQAEQRNQEGEVKKQKVNKKIKSDEIGQDQMDFQDIEVQQQSLYNKQLKRERREKDKNHRLNKSTIPPDNFDVRRKRVQYFERPNNPYERQPKRNNQFNDKRKAYSTEESYQSYRPRETQRRQSSDYGQNYRKNNNNYDNKEYRQPREDQRYQRQPREPRERSQDNYRSTEPRQSRQKMIYNQRKSHKKELQKRQANDMEFRQKFQTAGQLYRNQKVLQKWGDQNPQQTRSVKPMRSEAKIERSEEKPTILAQQSIGQVRRGRRIKK